MKTMIEARMCVDCGERRAHTARAFYCAVCVEARRQEQLRKGQEAHKALIAAGKAEHRMTYGGQPTVWAKNNKQDLVKQAEELVKRLRAFAQ